MRKAFTALAGTNYSTNQDFLEQARRFRRAFLKGLNDKGYFGENVTNFFSRRSKEDAFSEEKWQQRLAVYRERVAAGERSDDFADIRQWEPLPPDIVPAFEFEGCQPQFEEALWPAAILAFKLLLTYAIGFIVFIRYDVR